jgi:excisionase family DNA binding protein
MNQTTIHNCQSVSPERRTYRVEDIADILGISRTSAYALVQEGHFRSVRIGTAIRISQRSFDAWLDQQGVQ